MGKLINTALVFIGGMTAGGYCVVNAALKSETFTIALKNAVAEKTTEVLYGTECERHKRKVSYYDALHSSKGVNRCLEQADDIVFETREDAEKVLDAMEDIVKEHGWKSVDDAKVVRCRDGYYIKLPKAEEIK